ncbi:hypothetical protein TL16_g01046 [Triparma laevis f. inornata]|uniref:TLC domain-containing protein n=1 Tax=Triparma laevis f. inornata TaxID=1714386 RepID=A0A9W6ZJV1_9STRA|nr:hypothetical protein TL16_g01046 [Triparma laevis f. inornata]
MTTRTNLLLPSYVLSAVHAFAQVIVAFYNLLRFLSPIHLATELDDVHKCYYQCQCNGIEQTIYVMSSVMIVYFTIDLVLMYKTSSLSLSFVIHHFTFAFAAILQLAFNRSCFPYLWLSFGELSTLFLNARWYLKYHKNDVNTTKFIIVETLFAVTFFITRIVIYGLGLLHFFHYDKNIFNTTELWQITPFLFVGGYLLNAFWLAKIVGMMTKVRGNEERSDELGMR